MDNNSKLSKLGSAFKLDVPGWQGVVKGILSAAAAAGLTYAMQHLGDLDFNGSSPAVTAILTVAIHYLQSVVESFRKGD